MSDVTIPCPHCGYRLLGTPGRYDTCQECKKKIVWTKGRPYKNLIDVPNESHVINPPPTRRQHPPVPSTEYEPEQSSIMGFDGSEIFEFAQDHPVEPLNQKEKKKLAKEKKEQDHQKEEKKADVRVAPKWPNLPPLDDGTTMLLEEEEIENEEKERRHIGWGFISVLTTFSLAGFLSLCVYLVDDPKLYVPLAVMSAIVFLIQVQFYIYTGTIIQFATLLLTVFLFLPQTLLKSPEGFVITSVVLAGFALIFWAFQPLWCITHNALNLDKASEPQSQQKDRRVRIWKNFLSLYRYVLQIQLGILVVLAVILIVGTALFMQLVDVYQELISLHKEEPADIVVMATNIVVIPFALWFLYLYYYRPKHWFAPDPKLGKSHGPTVDRILAEKKVKSELELFRLKNHRTPFQDFTRYRSPNPPESNN